MEYETDKIVIHAFVISNLRSAHLLYAKWSWNSILTDKEEMFVYNNPYVAKGVWL